MFMALCLRILAPLAPLGGRREGTIEGRLAERSRILKRFRQSCEDLEEIPCLDRAKRTRIGDELWFPPSIAAVFPLATPSTNALLQFYTGSSSGSRSSSPELIEEFSDNEAWDRRVRGCDENTQTENQGLELVSFLISCAESIASGDHVATSYFLARLGDLASPTGAPIRRVIAYFTEALAFRAANLWPQVFTIVPPRELADQIIDDDITAFQALNHASPTPKFLHFTLNERLLAAFEGKSRAHIIDFDIKQGLQWPSLLHSLATRPEPLSHLRITGIGESKQDLQRIGDRLAGIADSLNLRFEFHPVVDRIEDVRLWMLHVKEGECVAVNCVLQMHTVLYDETGRAAMDLLRLIRSTNPVIVAIAEQEAEHNGPRWETRLAKSLEYYSAIFDSLDSILDEDSLVRIKVEEMFGREIRNIVACEGSERVERHENFERWRAVMEGGGFRNAGIGERATVQSRLVLRMYSDRNYSVDEQGVGGDGLTIKWSGQALYTVSAWAPVDVAGGSATSQPC